MRFKYVLTVLILLILIISSFGCAEKLQGKTVIKVNAIITENNSRPVIEDIQASKETVGPLQEYKDTPVNAPGVFLTTTTMEGRKIDYWVSKPYTGPGEYEIISEIKSDQPEGSILMVTIKVVNKDANVIAKESKFIDWVD